MTDARWTPQAWEVAPFADVLTRTQPLDEAGKIRPEFQAAAWSALTQAAGWGELQVPGWDDEASDIPSARPISNRCTPDVLYRGHNTPSAWASPKGAMAHGTFAAPHEVYAAQYATNQGREGLLPPTVGFLTSWRLTDLSAPASTNWSDRDGSLPYRSWLAFERAPGQRRGNDQFEVTVGHTQVTRQVTRLVLGRPSSDVNFLPRDTAVLPDTSDVDHALGLLQYAATRIRGTEALRAANPALTVEEAWARSAREIPPAEALAREAFRNKTLDESSIMRVAPQLQVEHAAALQAGPSLAAHDAALAAVRQPAAVQFDLPVGRCLAEIGDHVGGAQVGVHTPPGVHNPELFRELLAWLRTRKVRTAEWATIAMGAARAGAFPGTDSGYADLLATAPADVSRGEAAAAFWRTLPRAYGPPLNVVERRWAHQHVASLIEPAIRDASIPRDDCLLRAAAIAPTQSVAKLCLDAAPATATSRDERALLLTTLGLFPGLADGDRDARILRRTAPGGDSYFPIGGWELRAHALLGLARLQEVAKTGLPAEAVDPDAVALLRRYLADSNAPRKEGEEVAHEGHGAGTRRAPQDLDGPYVDEGEARAREDEFTMRAARWIAAVQCGESVPLEADVLEALGQGTTITFGSVDVAAFARASAHPTQMPPLTAAPSERETKIATDAVIRALHRDAQGAAARWFPAGYDSERSAEELRGDLNRVVPSGAEVERLRNVVRASGGFDRYMDNLMRCHAPQFAAEERAPFRAWVATAVGVQATPEPPQAVIHMAHRLTAALAPARVELSGRDVLLGGADGGADTIIRPSPRPRVREIVVPAAATERLVGGASAVMGGA